VTSLFAAQRVLDAADGILNLALDLIGFALGFGLAVTGYFSGNFLNLAFDLFDRAFDAILVHAFLLVVVRQRASLAKAPAPEQSLICGITLARSFVMPAACPIFARAEMFLIVVATLSLIGATAALVVQSAAPTPQTATTATIEHDEPRRVPLPAGPRKFQ